MIGRGELRDRRTQEVDDADRRIAEAERRIEQQKRLIESLAADQRDTREADFDLSRMYLLFALLQEFRRRAVDCRDSPADRVGATRHYMATLMSHYAKRPRL